MGGLFDYTIIWNCFDFPAGIVPVTKVESTDEEYEDGYQDLITKTIKSDIVGSRGMPIGIQVVSFICEDEKCLAVMKAIESEVGFKELPNLPN